MLILSFRSKDGYDEKKVGKTCVTNSHSEVSAATGTCLEEVRRLCAISAYNEWANSEKGTRKTWKVEISMTVIVVRHVKKAGGMQGLRRTDLKAGPDNEDIVPPTYSSIKLIFQLDHALAKLVRLRLQSHELAMHSQRERTELEPSKQSLV